jgi:hypothetical protein
MSKMLLVSVSAILFSINTSVWAAGGGVVSVGRVTSTTTTHPDGSKEVAYPNGRHEFYNANGAPQGINTTSSSGPGSIVNTYRWGPNSYGGPR